MIFLVIDTSDYAGHKYGFEPVNEYMEAAEVIDKEVQKILDAIESRSTRQDEEWLIAMTTDHGGKAKNHGDLD